MHHNDVTHFACTNFREQHRVFGIKRADRRHHMFLLGKTGTGKSTLMETMIRQDMDAGNGLVLLDPHGDLAERLQTRVPEHRRGDLIYWDVANNPTIGWNPLARVPPERRSLAAGGLLDAFKKLWEDSWGPRLEHLLRNALFALLDQPEATLSDILRLLDDHDFRRRAALRTANSAVRRFWLSEYEGYPSRLRAEAIAPLQNKVGAFLADPVLRRVLTAPSGSLDVRSVMDDGQILLVNLAKGRLGEDSAGLLGALLVSQLGLAALARADGPEYQRRDFYLYLDEFHTFTTRSIASMLAELRKYRLSLILASQHLSQIDPVVREAVLGNVGTLVSFRVGLSDAEVLEKEFAPPFSAHDLTSLPNHHIYLTLMIDGHVSRPFSAEVVRV